LELAANKLNQMIVEIRDFDKIKTDLDNAKNIYSILTESSMKLDKELFALRSEMVNYQSKLKDDTNKKQQLEILSLQLRDYQIKKARIEELFKHREAFVKHIEELEKAMGGGNLINLEIELRNSLAKEKEITAKIFGIDQIVKEKSIRLKDFGQTLANTLKEKENIRKFDKLIKELKIFESALEQTQIELRKEFVTAVNYTMNQLWNTLYPYQDFIGIRLFIEEGDYILQIQSKAGEWINVEGVASGGERSLSALALRIAFALVLAPQIRILILDEPTANLDSNAVSVLATTLREKISEFIDQTFLITHQAELEDAVTGNSYKLERDKSKDGVTKVIQLS
jgi:DNA repair exonuclease SbcCD ATPase subunit